MRVSLRELDLSAVIATGPRAAIMSRLSRRAALIPCTPCVRAAPHTLAALLRAGRIPFSAGTDAESR